MTLIEFLSEEIYLVLQEAIASGNASLVKLIMKYRSYQRNIQRIRGIPELLRKLKEVGENDDWEGMMLYLVLF